MKQMKNLIFIFLVGVMIFNLCSCAGDDDEMPICEPSPSVPCESVLTMTLHVDTCFEIESPPQNWINNIKDYSVVNLGYKPNSEDEFLIHRNDLTGTDTAAWIGKVNLCTGEIDHVVTKSYLGLCRPK